MALLELLPKTKALIDINSQLNFNLIGFWHLNVSLQLLDKSIFFLNFHFQISVVLLQLTDDEALSKVVRRRARFGGAALAWGTWLGHALLESDGELLQFFVSLVQFCLYLLQFSLKASVLILCNVVCDFQVSVVVLKVFFLHFNEIVEWLSLWLLFNAKNHFS